ncbi:MAG: hypothetical protein ACI8UO_001756 [Verrucomicrobiales bacterium]|jgi:hypothetical protein
MNNSIKAIIASLALGGAAIGGEMAAPADPVCAVGFTGSVYAGYDTDLYHRGANLGQDVISAGFNSNHDLGGLNLDLGIGYQNVTDPAVGDRLVTSAWTGMDLMGLDAAIGLNWYYFPEIDSAVDDNLEIGLQLSHDLGIATLNFGYYYDFESEGSYLEGGLSKTIALADCLDLNLGTGIGYGDDDYNTGFQAGGEHVFVKAGLTYHLTETAALSAYVAGNFLYGDAADLSDDDDDIYGGVSLSVSF